MEDDNKPPSRNEGESENVDEEEKVDDEKNSLNESEDEHVNENEEFSEDAEVLKSELEKIKIAQPETKLYRKKSIEIFDPDKFPTSYKDNLPKELIVLQYVESFRKQYVHLYRDRKPLFLSPVNECNVEKFVCTTIRPCQLPFKELYSWDGAAEFVADYLNFETLEPPYELPCQLISPATVLERQKGNCFEYSTLLCSLLIGAGYDAYVVSGYANKDTCLADEMRDVCPLLKKKVELKKEERRKQIKKYTVKPPKDLRSKFELKMEARKQEEIKAEEDRTKAEAEKKQAELEEPPPDPLHGLRIHSWVLVLSGKREVPEHFFIEPFTGISHPVNSGSYLGIESVWNHLNYWVCMADCSDGISKLNFDLGDCTLWEFIFPGLDKPQLLIPEAEEDLDLDEEEDKEDEVENHLDMPPSWVEPLRITKQEFETRCPKGKKTKLYKRAKLEKFAHYLEKDGVVSRLSIYDNKELTDLIMLKEYFDHRIDKLSIRVHNYLTGWITEHFHPGMPKQLKEHCYRANATEPENERTMIFYDEARFDGIVKRVETPLSMTEHFNGRDDFLFYKHVEFGKKSKKLGPQDDTTNEANFRPIIKMIMKFHHNPVKPANADIRKLVFLVAEDKIQITYHTENQHIASSFREFIKPQNWEEKGAILAWSQDMHSTFQANPKSENMKQVELYQTLLLLLKIEESCRDAVRDSEEEVKLILANRLKEEEEPKLEISVYDTERNEQAKRHRLELEAKQKERKRKQDMEIDYLAPFLAQIGDPEKITKNQAPKLRDDCLTDLKQRLIDKANLIQSRFEKETQELQKKQAWYQQNQVSMSKADEEDYLNYCSETMFRINILESRLNRHKEMAPHKYMALEQKLRNDPRLSEHLN